MQYFFECGHFVSLSIAELSAVLYSYGISKNCVKKISDNILLFESKSVSKDVLDRIFNRLGGFIRYGEIIDDLDSFLEPYFTQNRVVFGISAIGDIGIGARDIQKLSNDIKRNFRKADVSSRFLLPKRDELNAAQIINNKILENGFELCIFDTSLGRLYAKTLAIQDLNAFVKRDLSKPSVDFDMGVLPQKLARIMCNLTGLKEGIIWDPFCGSGTVLMEAAVLGFDVLGSDIDIGALQITKENLEWLAYEGLINQTMYNVFHLDVSNVEKKKLKELKRSNIRAVVCEPFMGPAQRRVLTQTKAESLLTKVKELYTNFFEMLEGIAREGFMVVIVLPSYKTDKGWATFSISDIIGKRWDIINKEYCSEDLKWSRINSIITRNIFILSKR